jgi:uncharacterized membrane protein
MKELWLRIKREPVLLLGFVSAAVLLAVSFGLKITDTQISAIAEAIGTFLVLMGASGVARRSTVPYQDVTGYVSATGESVEGPALGSI